VIASDVVWAEVAAGFGSGGDARRQLEAIGVGFAALDEQAALAAGEAFGAYRRRGGKRDRVVAHFLIGAHAAGQADRLLSRDRGFYRTYFSKLAVLDPSAGGGRGG